MARRNREPGFLARIRAWLDTVASGAPAARQRSPYEAPLLGLLRDNERIWTGFRNIELDMLSAETLAEILNILRTRLPQQFPSIAQAALAWLDPEHEVTRLVAQQGIDPAGVFIPLPDWPAHPSLPTARRPWLGVPDEALRQLLFARFAGPVRSVAIAPLWLRGQRMGYLLQASPEAGHYTADAATDLLEHLAAVTALCVDNAINRVYLLRDGLTDPLTDIANRRFFERRLEEETSLWRRQGGNLSCLLVDIDHFKQINDQHGHAVGDQVLARTARMLNSGRRASDVLARYGGEEFVLLLPATEARRAAEIAERLRHAVAVHVLDRLPRVTVSIGVATLTHDWHNTVKAAGELLLRAADDGLYRAKAAGRNRVVAMTADDMRLRVTKDATAR